MSVSASSESSPTNIKRTNFYSLFTVLTQKERDQFQQALGSKYFVGRQSKQLLTEFASLREFVGEGEKLNLAVFSALDYWKRYHPNKPFKDDSVRQTCFKLAQLMEKFLVQAALKKEGQVESFLLIRELNKRNEKKKLGKLLKNAIKATKKQSDLDVDIQLVSYLIQIEKYNFTIKHSKTRFDEAQFKKVVETLDDFYRFAKLKDYCEWLEMRIVANINMQEFPGVKVLKSMKPSPKDPPALKLYYQIANMLESGPSLTKLEMEELMEGLEAVEDLLSRDDQRSIYTMVLNFFIREANEGQEIFVETLTEIYEKGLKSGFFEVDGYLLPAHYKNIATHLILQFEKGNVTAERVENFIETYHSRMNPELGSVTQAFVRARFDFSLGDFESSLGALTREGSPPDSVQNLEMNWLIIKCYFELGEMDLCNTKNKNLSAFLRRNKPISEYRKKIYKIRKYFMSKLVRINPGDAAAVDSLRKEIEAEVGLLDKKWFLDKLDEF